MNCSNFDHPTAIASMVNSSTSLPTWLGHLIFAALAVLAVVLYQERVIFLDAAFQSFNAIQFGHPAIQANRFGAALTQMVPVVTAKLGASLPLVLISYSLSFVLLHWLFFVLADRVFKQPALALAIAFFNIFLFNRSFYWIQNELVQAIGLNLLVWAITLHALTRGWRWWRVGLLLLLLPTLVFFHPLVVFAYFFCCAFFLLDRWGMGIRRDRWVLVGMAAAFLAVLWVKNQWFMPEYDLAAGKRFSQGRIRDFLAAFPHNPSLGDFGRALARDFYLLPLGFLFIIIYYIRNAQYIKLLLTGGALSASLSSCWLPFRRAATGSTSRASICR